MHKITKIIIGVIITIISLVFMWYIIPHIFNFAIAFLKK